MLLTHIKFSHQIPAFAESSNCVLDSASPSINTKKRFTSEASLVNLFEALLNNRKKPCTTGYLKEFDCSNGIADIVLFEKRKDWKANTMIGEVPSRWAYALHRIPYRQTFSVELFADAAGVTEKRALQALRQYAELDFCKEKKAKRLWTKIRQPIPVVNKIYAIEAKLYDWKRALSQAYRYLDYANQSWVILDHGRINPALANIKKFQRLNVGLASLAGTGHIITHFDPFPASPRSPQKVWQANSEIAARFMTLNA